MDATKKRFRKRDAILDYLRHTTAHPSAETIYTDLKAQIPDLAMGTVYRNLALFKEQGLIISVATVNGTERFDGNTCPHVHFICTDCGAVQDLGQVQIPQALRESAAASSGGQVFDCQLTFSGLCRECNTKNRGETA